MNPDVLHTVFSFVSYWLLVSAVIFSVFGVRHRQPVLRSVFLITCVLLVTVELDGLHVVSYMRGFISDLSITTVILVVCEVLYHLLGLDVLGDDNRRYLLTAVAVGGFVLYPMTLGLTWVDPYTLGFGSPFFVATLVLFCMWGYRVRRGAAACIAASVLAFNMGILESSNMWDYLLDPLVTVYAWVWVLTDLRHKKEDASLMEEVEESCALR